MQGNRCTGSLLSEPSLPNDQVRTSPGADVPPEPAAPFADPAYQVHYQTDRWTDLPQSALAEKLRQHCSICARWFHDPTAMKRHIIKAHPQQWSKAEAGLEEKCNAFSHHLTRDGKCPFRLRTSYNRHFKQCNIIMQTALMRLQHEDLPTCPLRRRRQRPRWRTHKPINSPSSSDTSFPA